MEKFKKLWNKIWSFIKQNKIWFILGIIVLLLGAFIYEKVDKHIITNRLNKSISVLTEQQSEYVREITELNGINNSLTNLHNQDRTTIRSLESELSGFRTELQSVRNNLSEFADGLSELGNLTSGAGEIIREIGKELRSIIDGLSGNSG